MKVPALPSVKVVLATEVMIGAALTVRVKVWVASVPIPLEAVRVIENTPDWVGVPARTPPAVRVTPVGRAPVSLKVGAGEPVAVAVRVPALPSVKLVLAVEVMVGALLGPLTFRVKD